MGFYIDYPYRKEPGLWLKGNLHCHTTLSDGTLSPQELIDAYAAKDYDFLVITDHDMLTDPAKYNFHDMLAIPGNEISANGPDVLHVNAQSVIHPHVDRQRVIDAINREGGFAILNHPKWGWDFAHCPHELAEKWDGYLGIEIYNGMIEILPGSALATDHWDLLLSKGKRVWGFASDDTHHADNIGRAYNVVQVSERSVAAVLEAFRQGSFYASTGVTIERIEMDHHNVRIQTRDAQRIAVFADCGARQVYADSATLEFTIPTAARWKYLRIECWGMGDTMAWTQPFFLT